MYISLLLLKINQIFSLKLNDNDEIQLSKKKNEFSFINYQIMYLLIDYISNNF